MDQHIDHLHKVPTSKGNILYATTHEYNNVYVIDTSTNTPTLKVGNHLLGVAVTPDGKKVYVTDISSNNVSLINTTTNALTATVNVDVTPWGVAVSPDGTEVYIKKL